MAQGGLSGWHTPFDPGVVAFIALLVGVGVARLFEMRLSRRHQRALVGEGARLLPEPGFPLMVALHTAVLIGAGIEVLAARRPFVPAIGIPAALVFVLANALRIWVIRTLAGHWNVRVVDSASLGVVSTGPFRWIRHPNYVAVFLELLALPLIHGAYVTAGLGALAHLGVLARRIRLEERVLDASPTYRADMSHKPRFLPGLPGRPLRQQDRQQEPMR